MKKIKAILWMIRTFGIARWYRYEQIRREGRTINYSDAFSPEELNALEAAGIAPWRTP